MRQCVYTAEKELAGCANKLMNLLHLVRICDLHSVVGSFMHNDNLCFAAEFANWLATGGSLEFPMLALYPLLVHTAFACVSGTGGNSRNDICIHVGRQVGPMGRVLMDFGPKLGDKLGPSWH